MATPPNTVSLDFIRRTDKNGKDYFVCDSDVAIGIPDLREVRFLLFNTQTTPRLIIKQGDGGQRELDSMKAMIAKLNRKIDEMEEELFEDEE